MKEQILNALIESGYHYGYYGIRTDLNAYSIGEDLPCSRSFDVSPDEESEELGGTCATGFGYLWYDEDDMSEVEKCLNRHLAQNYPGDHMYLIGGRDAEYGNDPGEVIIRNAVVVAVIK